ncbi:hypothetical protein D932_01613 [Enterococcus casseliflavus 14-MB-W-14]|uniref:immunoglobulin-like domain-containing protein n=1 Tax=Enterococcus casseliflavus TaxID=37734 RepID=UPI000353BA5E|nr:immunoglobulin-like domain-containing protein [Enterococcus casseliflavus]EPH64130.1 hypothetical protein D932_01613 [Enterococcus casseliflavus 14-MB-W-14]
MTEKSTIPRLFPDTFSIGQVELTGQYTGPIVRGRLFINDQHVSWGGTFNNGFFTYYVGPDRIKRHDKVELVGYDADNNEIARAVVTIKVEAENALFKKNESMIRIQAERVDPISTKVVFFSHDRGTAKMYFKLEKDGAPQPLSNGTVVPICLEGGSETSDMGRFRHVYHAVIEDTAEGLVSIILKNNILGHQGRVDGSIYIKPPNDQQLDTAGRFLFHIERSPIDDMTESVSQFYYEGFHEIYEKLANAKQQVEDDLTEMRASVKVMLDEIEAEVDRYKKDVEAKFTAINNNLTSLAATITQLENRLKTVRNEIEALFNILNLSARNLVPNSSFYKDVHGWAVNTHLTTTSTGTYTRFVKAAATPSRATISREAIDDQFKPGIEYTIGLMVYVESVSGYQNSSSSTVFLRTNNGAMLDAPLGTIDWTKVGEWQLVTGTGTTRPNTWVNRPQITIAIGENTICTFRIKEFVIVEGNRYLGWLPAPGDKANQAEFEVTQQKVQTLEQNTIRLTNQFPDPDFSKGTPRPVAEGGIGVNYNDGVGVVLNNPTAVQGRIYWGSPPLGLMVGKTYNVSMYLNAGGASAGRVFIAGTSTGDNFSFSVPNDSPVWVHGTIGLTNWSAFSVWLPPNTSLRIRELYIYEANTDITTARIERLEKDNSLPAVVPTFDRRFISYSADNGIWHCQVERTGNIVALSGAIANTEAISTTGTEKILMARLPVGYRPKKTVNRVMAGSGTAIFNMEIDPTGEIYMARYRGATTSFTYAAVQFVGAWLNVGTTFLGEDI